MFIVKVPGVNAKGKTKGCERAGNDILKILNYMMGFGLANLLLYPIKKSYPFVVHMQESFYIVNN